MPHLQVPTMPIWEMVGIGGAGAAPVAIRLIRTCDNAGNVDDGIARAAASGAQDVLGSISFVATATRKICTWCAVERHGDANRVRA